MKLQRSCYLSIQTNMKMMKKILYIIFGFFKQIRSIKHKKKSLTHPLQNKSTVDWSV